MGERIAAVACAVAAFYMLRLAWDFPAGGNLFPVFACGAIIVTSLMMVVRTFVSPDIFEKSFAPRLTREALVPVVATAATILYVFAIFWIGYFTSTLVYIVGSALAVGVRDYRTITLTVLIALPLMYGFFEIFLQAGLPRGWMI